MEQAPKTISFIEAANVTPQADKPKDTWMTDAQGNKWNWATGEEIPIAQPAIKTQDQLKWEQLANTPPSTPTAEKPEMDMLETVVYSVGHVFAKAAYGITAAPRVAYSVGAGATNLVQNLNAKTIDALFGTNRAADRVQYGFSEAWESTDVFTDAFNITSPKVSTGVKLAGNIAETVGAVAVPGMGAATAATLGVAGGTVQTAADVLVKEDNSTVGVLANLATVVLGPIAFKRIADKAFALDSVRKLAPGNQVVLGEVERVNSILAGDKLPVTTGTVNQAGEVLETAIDRIKLVAKSPEELAALDVIAKTRKQAIEAANVASTKVDELAQQVIEGGVTQEIRNLVGDETAVKLQRLFVDHHGEAYKSLKNLTASSSFDEMQLAIDKAIKSDEGFKAINRATGETVGTGTADKMIDMAKQPKIAVVGPTEEARFLIKQHIPVDLSGIDTVALTNARNKISSITGKVEGIDKRMIEDLVSSTSDLNNMTKVSGIAPSTLTAEGVGKEFVDTVSTKIKEVNKAGRELYNTFIQQNGGMLISKAGIAEALKLAEANPTLAALVERTKAAMYNPKRIAEHVTGIEKSTIRPSDATLEELNRLALHRGGVRIINKRGEYVSDFISKEDGLLAAQSRNMVEKGHKIVGAEQMTRKALVEEAKAVVEPTFREMEDVRKLWGQHMTSIDAVTKGQASRVYAAFKAAHEDAVLASGDVAVMSSYKSMNMFISSSKKDASVLKEIIGRLESRDTAEYGAIVNKITNASKSGAETLRAIDSLLPSGYNDVKAKLMLMALNPTNDSKAAMAIWNKMSPEAKDFYRVRFGDKFVDNYERVMNTVKKARIQFDADGTAYLPKTLSQMEVLATGTASTVGYVTGLVSPTTTILAGLAYKLYPIFENITATAIAKSPALTKFVSEFGTDMTKLHITEMRLSDLNKTINSIGYLVRKHKDAEGAKLLKALADYRNQVSKTIKE